MATFRFFRQRIRYPDRASSSPMVQRRVELVQQDRHSATSDTFTKRPDKYIQYHGPRSHKVGSGFTAYSGP